MWAMLLLTSSMLNSFLNFTMSSRVDDGIVLTVKRYVNWPMLAYRALLISWIIFRIVRAARFETEAWVKTN